MSYLIYNDYKKSIQNLNLLQVLGGDLTILTDLQKTAQQEAESYLTQKYNIDAEFTDTNKWDFTKTYYANDRVYLDAITYLSTNTYSINDQTLYNGSVFIANASTTGAFDPTKWVLLGVQYDIFYIGFPYSLFNINNHYPKGSEVFWNGYKYVSISESPSVDRLNIQYGQYRNVPYSNYFPGEDNGKQWGVGIEYTVPAGTLPINATYYTKGDNRSLQMVEYLSDMVIYKIHKRISPNNIPVQRVDANNMAIQWLMDAATGAVTARLPLRQPKSGGRIRYGGNIQNINHY